MESWISSSVCTKNEKDDHRASSVACGTKKSITESRNVGFTCILVSTESDISSFTFIKIRKREKREFPQRTTKIKFFTPWYFLMSRVSLAVWRWAQRRISTAGKQTGFRVFWDWDGRSLVHRKKLFHDVRQSLHLVRYSIFINFITIKNKLKLEQHFQVEAIFAEVPT